MCECRGDLQVLGEMCKPKYTNSLVCTRDFAVAKHGKMYAGNLHVAKSLIMLGSFVKCIGSMPALTVICYA